MGRHHPVAAIDFRVAERSPVHAGFQIVRDDEAGRPAKFFGVNRKASLSKPSTI
jgi:hypothetical protein